MNKVLYLFFVLFGMLPAYNSYGQQNLDDSLFQNFRNDVQIELEDEGGLLWDYETELSYALFINGASIESLVRYTDDSIAMYRAIVFSGLAQKNADENILKSIREKYSNDTAKLTSVLTVKAWMDRVYQSHLDKKDYVVDFTRKIDSLRNKKVNDIVVPGLYHRRVPKDSLLSIDSIKYSDDSIKFKSFDLTIGKKVFKTNNMLTPEIKEAIKNSTSGQMIYIDNINAEKVGKGKTFFREINFRIK